MILCSKMIDFEPHCFAHWELLSEERKMNPMFFFCVLVGYSIFFESSFPRTESRLILLRTQYGIFVRDWIRNFFFFSDEKEWKEFWKSKFQSINPVWFAIERGTMGDDGMPSRLYWIWYALPIIPMHPTVWLDLRIFLFRHHRSKKKTHT